jgi:DNA-binding LacI/PurR family transcriptional regulator
LLRGGNSRERGRADFNMDRERRGKRAMGINMNDVAVLANVSKPTVSRVLNGSPLVNETTRARVLEVARAHGYVVNRNAQKLRQTRAETIAVVLDFGSHRGGRIGDPFVFELLAGVSEALSVRNQDLLLSPPGLTDAQACADLITGRGADGLIFLGQGDREPTLTELARSDVPFVVWGAVNPRNAYCAVGSDNTLGGRLAGEYFLSRGARRWLFVGNTEHEEIRLRFEGLHAIAAGAGDGVEAVSMVVADMSYAGVRAAAAEWLAANEAPDAVFAFSDTAAMALISAFRDAGLVAPRDYALVGYNNIPPAAHFTPAITTIEQETHPAGAILVEKLMQRIDGANPKPALLPTRMIVRET